MLFQTQGFIKRIFSGNIKLETEFVPFSCVSNQVGICTMILQCLEAMFYSDNIKM